MPGEFSFALSVAALDLLWEDLGLGSTPVVFDLPSIGETMDDRARLREVVYQDLTSRNLASRGRPAAEVEEVLVLLTRFGLAIDGAFTSVGDAEPTAFRAAADARLATLARKQGQLIHFTTLRPEGLLSAAVALIGDQKPGPGKSFTYPDADAVTTPPPRRDQSEDGGGSILQPIRAPAVGHDAARRAAQVVLGKPRERGGWFAVIGRDRNGRELHAPSVVWLDTSDGRYLAYRRPGPDGQPWLTCTPADSGRIAQALRAAL